MRITCVTCVALASLIGGCDGCGKDKPYTPFGVVSASATPSSIADEAKSAAADEDAGAEKPRFAAKPAITAPPNASKWTLDGRPLDAPPGRMFDRGVVADLDADQKNEIVAWTVPAGGVAGQAPGELWLYPAQGAAKKITALPGFVPTSGDCKHTTALAQTGPKSVTLDVSAACTGKVLARSPTRALVVAAPLSERSNIVTLRFADAAPGETLALDVDSSDRDNDGRDDARVAITVRANGSERPATAELVWLDRAAGSSRDTTSLAGSIGRAAASELWRSKRKKLGPSVRTGVANVRRLLSTVCAEGNVPRVFAEDGTPFRCGSTTVVNDRLLLAEVQSAITEDDLLLGFAALGRNGWYFGKASDKQRQDAEKQLLGKVKTIEAPAAVTVTTAPVKRGADPRWSPIAFEASGSLLVQTAEGVVRINANGAGEPAADVTAWPLELSRSDGARIGPPRRIVRRKRNCDPASSRAGRWRRCAENRAPRTATRQLWRRRKNSNARAFTARVERK